MLNIVILLKTQYFFGRHDQSNQYLIIWSAFVDRYKKTRKLLLKYFSRCILHLFCSQHSKAGTKFFAQIKKKCLKFWIIIICFRLSYLNYICKTIVRNLCQLRFLIYESIWKAYTYSLNSLINSTIVIFKSILTLTYCDKRYDLNVKLLWMTKNKVKI